MNVPIEHAAPLWRTVSWLGLAQIVSWGSLYYSLTVLAKPIRAELGFSELSVFGAFTAGVIASGSQLPRSVAGSIAAAAARS